MDFLQMYKKETGKNPIVTINNRDYYTLDYISWLKKKKDNMFRKHSALSTFGCFLFLIMKLSKKQGYRL
jgi:hypothetical protein